MRRIMGPLLHFQSYGAGAGARTLVLLHGLFGLGVNLGAVARALSGAYRVLVPDLRNHGRSFHAPGMDYPSLAGDLLRLLDAEGLESAALLGHSMGGKLAMQFALDHPGRTQRIVVADIAPVAYAPHHDSVFRALRAAAERPDADRRATQVILELYLEQPEVVALLLMHRVRLADGSWAWRLGLGEIEAGYPQILAAPAASEPYAGPALFIRGESSDYVRAEHAVCLHALFPSARIETIAGAGHWLHAEQPEAFIRLVREFLH